MKHRWLCVVAPLVAGHAACIAVPAATVALGAPILMPICGGGPALPAPPMPSPEPRNRG
jgi:hypothetical protein